MTKLNLIKEAERLRLAEDEYDDVVTMFERLAKKGIDPIDMIAHEFGWGTHELDELAKQQGFKNSSDWLKSFERGVVENQENLVEDLTAAFVNHYKDDPMGMFMHAKSSYLDAISRAKNFSFKAAGLYRAHSSMSKQEFQDAVMKHFVPHLMKHGFPKHASAGWGEAEHDLMKSLTQDVKQGVKEGLNEAKTKTKTKPDITDTFKQKPDQPLTKKDDKKAEKPKEEPKDETPKFKVSSKDETLKKTAGIRMNDRAAELLSQMKNVEADPDDPGYPKHETLPSTSVKPENVPAVINKAMTVKGFLNPEWHIVANLPGNMATAIRTVGRKLFKSFTKTPTDKIVMIGNVMNQGPNTKEEINAAAKWLKNTGQEVSSGDIDFSDFMPGYRADIKMYDAAGCRFLLVEDFAGRYIYVWPHSDSVTMSSAPQLTKEDINIIKEAELRFRELAGL